jgi:hydroxypyruvate isomerase
VHTNICTFHGIQSDLSPEFRDRRVPGARPYGFQSDKDGPCIHFVAETHFMTAITQSVSWWCFTPRLMAPEAFLTAAAEAGFKAIELVPPEYAQLVCDFGLKISSMGGHNGIANGLNRVDQHDRIEQEIRAKLELAQLWSVPNLICFSGERKGLNDAEGAKVTAEGFARLAPLAEAAGVTLVLELLNSKVDHPDYQADHTAWGVEVCKQVNSPAVKLLYDIYHMQIMEGDLIRTIREAHPWIGHYHTAGNPGRNDLDEEQEIYYPSVLRAIRDTGYTGYLAHEFLPKGDPIQALKNVFQLCEPYLR